MRVRPRLVHRIWLSSEDEPDEMPREFVKFGKDLQEMNPDWVVYDWTDRASLPTLRHPEVFASAQAICPKDWKRFEADCLRLELLYAMGGIYVDCDTEPVKPLTPLLADVDCFVAWSPNRGPGGKRLFTQAVIGASPGHAFIKACLDGLPTAIRKHHDQPLAKMIGPWHITRTYNACDRETQDTVKRFPDFIFGPQSILERDAGQAPDLSQAVLHHRWNTTLRKKGRALG